MAISKAASLKIYSMSLMETHSPLSPQPDTEMLGLPVCTETCLGDSTHITFWRREVWYRGEGRGEWDNTSRRAWTKEQQERGWNNKEAVHEEAKTTQPPKGMTQQKGDCWESPQSQREHYGGLQMLLFTKHGNAVWNNMQHFMLKFYFTCQKYFPPVQYLSKRCNIYI